MTIRPFHTSLNSNEETVHDFGRKREKEGKRSLQDQIVDAKNFAWKVRRATPKSE